MDFLTGNQSLKIILQYCANDEEHEHEPRNGLQTASSHNVHSDVLATMFDNGMPAYRDGSRALCSS